MRAVAAAIRSRRSRRSAPLDVVLPCVHGVNGGYHTLTKIAVDAEALILNGVFEDMMIVSQPDAAVGAVGAKGATGRVGMGSSVIASAAGDIAGILTQVRSRILQICCRVT